MPEGVEQHRSALGSRGARGHTRLGSREPFGRCLWPARSQKTSQVRVGTKVRKALTLRYRCLEVSTATDERQESSRAAARSAKVGFAQLWSDAKFSQAKASPALTKQKFSCFQLEFFHKNRMISLNCNSPSLHAAPCCSNKNFLIGFGKSPSHTNCRSVNMRLSFMHILIPRKCQKIFVLSQVIYIYIMIYIYIVSHKIPLQTLCLVFHL